MAETPPQPTPPQKNGLKDTALIILAIAGIALLLVVLLAAHAIDAATFYFACAVVLAYPILKTISPHALAWLQRKQIIEKEGVIKHYKRAVQELLAENRDWGYPEFYQPNRCSYLPFFDYVVFEATRDDVSRQLGAQAALNVDFEGTIVYDCTTKKIVGIHKNKEYAQVINHLRENEAYYAKQPRAVTLPATFKTTEMQYGLP